MRILVGLTMSALMAVAAVQAFSPRHTPPLAETRLAVEKIHFNTLVRSQAGLIAGGELGKLLYSRNEGKDWTPATVSQDRQALITQVVFAKDGLRGLAVGHEGWILRSEDGGLSWNEVAFDEKNGEPLMSAANIGDRVWLSVGAFGRALRSEDDGKTWQAYALPPGVEDKHLNRIVRSDDGAHLLIVGERGLVLRSDDQGASWTQVPDFYNGSFYNAMPFVDGGWLVYGMRGNAYVGHDGGEWKRVHIPVPASFFGHARLPDGRVLLVGQGSLVASTVMATSKEADRPFELTRVAGRATLTDIVLDANGAGWIASDAGLQTYLDSAPAPKTAGARP